MKINKSLKSRKIKFALDFSISASFVFLFLAWFLEKELMYFFSVIFLLLYIFLFLKDYNYFFYSDDKNKIILRFFRIRSFFDNNMILRFLRLKNFFKSKKKSYEIHKDKLFKYKIKKNFFSKEIIFFQKTENGIFEYPAVNLSILSKEEINKIERSINQIIRNNKK
ncbi:MAG: hypothetical protein B6I24_05590 [Bacteroidetes bacterium 4572_128]|nr:MAG: hypothetical protein B6I24_05590 [Bacteroidetes bacterium 4572_128]